MNNKNILFFSWHDEVLFSSVTDHMSLLSHCDVPSPFSPLLTVFVSSDEREVLYFKEDGAGFGVDAGIVLCTNKGEADIWGGSSCTGRALQVVGAVIS